MNLKLVSLKLCSLLIIGIFLLTGCSGEPDTDQNNNQDHAHDHDHDHDGHHHKSEEEAHGPNKGHLVKLGDYHAEYIHHDDGRVEFFVLGKDKNKAMNVATDAVSLTTTVEGGEPKTYNFDPVEVETVDEQEVANHFHLVDKAMRGNLIMTKGVKNVLSVTIDGEPVTATIVHDPTHDH